MRLRSTRRKLAGGALGHIRKAIALGQDDSDISLFGDEATPFEYADTGVYAPSTESDIDLTAQGNAANADLLATLSNASDIINTQNQVAVPSSTTSSATSLINSIAKAFAGTPSSNTGVRTPANQPSAVASWLQGSSAEYVIFGGVGLILLLAITSQRRR
jgi:hypothetical protein